MKKLPSFVTSATLALVFTGSATAQATGTMPEFADATWFNTPPLSVEDMEDHAVLVEVFRTW